MLLGYLVTAGRRKSFVCDSRSRVKCVMVDDGAGTWDVDRVGFQYDKGTEMMWVCATGTAEVPFSCQTPPIVVDGFWRVRWNVTGLAAAGAGEIYLLGEYEGS